MGNELNSEWYDEVYRNGGSEEIYFKHYSETPWINVWTEVFNRVKLYAGTKILDIGCGPGQFSNFITDIDTEIKYIGLDFSKTAIDAAIIRSPNHEFRVANVLEYDIGSIEYDIVITMEFLEHIVQDIYVLNKIRSGTMILATLPNMDSEGHVRFLSKNKDTAKSEILNRYSECCDIIDILYFPYSDSQDSNADYLIIMKKK
tara:strand:+ start:529 stop:1134 length:606 start_codon:yes stop_codon:yes gene_type:complete